MMGTITDNIDWKTFLGCHDVIWEELPKAWEEGAFIGNGLIGAMVYALDDRRIVWDVCRSDVTEHRAGTKCCRLPIGKLEYHLSGNIINVFMRLELWNAEVRGKIKTDKGSVCFRAFSHAGETVNVIEIGTTGEESGEFIWNPDQSLNPRKVVLGQEEPDKNPEPLLELDKDVHVCVQKRIEGGSYCTAWKELNLCGRKQVVYLSIDDSFPDDGSRKKAVDNVRKAEAIGIEGLENSHRTWWERFYKKSFLSVPDVEIERFYWIQIYKLGSATRADRPAMDVMGLWFRMTRWPAIWWNLNIQLAYWPVYTSNHLELGESLIQLLNNNIGNLSQNAEPYSEDSASISMVTGYDCVGKALEPGDLTWALHNYWLQCRYSMDDKLLREGLYPLLRRNVNLYIHLLSEGDDGKLHLPVLSSPEYPIKAEDNNYSLSLLRWGCCTLISICERLDISDPLIDKWKEIINRLADYQANENVLMIGKDVPYDRSHRHFSHLIMIYPLYLINWEQIDNREMMLKSVEYWQYLDDAMCGYSHVVAAGMYTSMCLPEKALSKLQQFLKEKVTSMGSVLLNNTMYVETDVGKGKFTESNPTIETPLAFAKVLQDFVLQSWGDKIRVFPSVPDCWKDIAFHNFLAEGAFLVSGARKDGRTQWVRVESLAGEKCRLLLDFYPARVLSERKIDVIINKDNILEIDLRKGEAVTLKPVNIA